MNHPPEFAITGKRGASARRYAPVWIRVGFWASIVIALAAAVHRLILVAKPSLSTAPRLTGLDETFQSHAALTVTHILPAMVFVVLTPLVVLRRSNARWVERLLIFTGLVVGVTAYAMSIYAVGGWVERSAVLFFNSLFLYSVLQASRFQQRADARRERRWLIRAIGILLGIATTRPVMALFYATSSLTHLQPQQFFGIAFWVGFSINTIGVELWLRSR